MKVLLYSELHPVWMVSLARGLSKYVQVILVVPNDKLTSDQIKYMPEKVILESFPLSRASSFINLLNFKYFYEIVKKHNPDIIHFNEDPNPFLNILSKYFLKIKKCVTIHDVNIGHGQTTPFHKLNRELTLSHIEKIVVLGKNTKSLLKRRDLSDKRIYQIYHGNMNYYTNFIDKECIQDKNTVIFFGRLLKYKGLKYLLKAEPIISSQVPNFKIIIVVHGEPFDNYNKYVSNRDNLEIIEKYVSDNELYKFFLRSKITILPYIEASQSGPMLMSFAFSIPVISSNVGNLPQYVNQSKAGLLVNSKNPEELAKAIISILNNNKIRKRMSFRAKEYSDNYLSWKRIAKDLLKIYNIK